MLESSLFGGEQALTKSLLVVHAQAKLLHSLLLLLPPALRPVQCPVPGPLHLAVKATQVLQHLLFSFTITVRPGGK